MSPVAEKILLFLNMVTDSRLRKDVKALKCASKGYTYFAWQLCKDTKIDEILKEKPTSIKDILKKRGVKNKELLECVLDLLVGNKIISYRKGRYYFKKEPPDFYKSGEFFFLQKHYPHSVNWTDVLFSKAEDALMKGRRSAETSFDDKNFLSLWEGIMEESPYSIRKIAIRKFKRHVKDGYEILDLGCGSGVSLEQILWELRKKRVNITGVDASKISLDRAGTRLRKLYDSTENLLLKENIKRVELKCHNLREKMPSHKKFDLIFMSLLVHHIPKKQRKKFFENLSGILKPNGRVCVFQIIHKSKFERASMWVMHVVPSHEEYPFKDEWLRMFSSVFRKVKYWLDGMIVLAEK